MSTTHAAGYTKHQTRPTSPRPNPYAAYQVVRGVVLINAAPSATFHVDTHTCPICRLKEYRTGVVMRVAYAHKTTTQPHMNRSPHQPSHQPVAQLTADATAPRV